MKLQNSKSFNYRVRWYIYDYFIRHERPPTVSETASELNADPEEVEAAYHSLHQDHVLLLEEETEEVRMAYPLSAVPTNFRVHVEGRSWWANCAWDMFGIPAMLDSDARINALYTDTGEKVTFVIENGAPQGAVGLVHFALPFREWYENTIFT